ncbi:hypothetical protein SAMN05216388_104714 [Halorientalis persicus]|uniref:DUF8139 domain-containing protein n=1 Tax=Halorientalis persicus TaxID=1367881 RepID=A0A1H8W3R5_9EURY|nr:hypothetical protein [Halorientalis persicus]SEP22279.1 hypothetical protein SAMN05216388_104714 [Halorientalis persicus]
MEDVPQPADEPYSTGDEVMVYVAEGDPDARHHGKTGIVVDISQDALSTQTERELDSHSYKIEVDSQELDVWFRHRDLVPDAD